jgi:uncharacterized protein
MISCSVAFRLGLLSLLVGCQVSAPKARPPFDAAAYAHELASWKASRVRAIAGPDGWITLSGLYWLDGSSYTLGGGEAEIPIPGTTGVLGRLLIDSATALFIAESGRAVRVQGEVIDSIALESDGEGRRPTVVAAGTSTFRVLDRSGRLALRVKDSASILRQTFAGIETFPVDTAFRVLARLERPTQPRVLRLANIVGLIEDHRVAGILHFALHGRSWTLEAVQEPGDSALFILFRDVTSGTESYPAGRYLSTAPPDSAGLVVLDFNRAYNPPCAFTAFATCPMPPRQNVLPIAIPAGERRYAETHTDVARAR